jgi:hypothetical protein
MSVLHRGRLKPRKAKGGMKHVQSGIGLTSYGQGGDSEQQSFLTSRTARVLLAGAGFLADAVSYFLSFSLIISKSVDFSILSSLALI